jgi:hypothetical protein
VERGDRRKGEERTGGNGRDGTNGKASIKVRRGRITHVSADGFGTVGAAEGVVGRVVHDPCRVLYSMKEGEGSNMKEGERWKVE